MGKDETSVPDEEWERFLREAGAAAPGAPEEPSARARAVGRRLRERGGPAEGWRTYQPPPRKRGKVWYALGLVAAVAVLAAVLNPGMFGGGDGGADGSGASAAPAVEPASQLPTLKEPFKGSPADEWRAGTDGISMPRARATGWMSKAQVAQALDRSLDFLADASLDRDVLRGERPAKAIALINPHQPDMRKYLSTAFARPSKDNDPLLLFSRFPQDKVRLVGDVVKTRGEVTFREGERGAVEVTSDVTYVYPLVRAARGSHEVARTIVRRKTVMSWDNPAAVVTDAGTFSLLSYEMDSTNGGCDEYTGYFTPDFTADRLDKAPGDGPLVDPYDRGTPMEERMKAAGDGECGTATRT